MTSLTSEHHPLLKGHLCPNNFAYFILIAEIIFNSNLLVTTLTPKQIVGHKFFPEKMEFAGIEPTQLATRPPLRLLLLKTQYTCKYVEKSATEIGGITVT